MEGKLQISTMSCKPLGSIISFIPLGYKILIDIFFFPESIKKRKYVPETEVEVETDYVEDSIFCRVFLRQNKPYSEEYTVLSRQKTFMNRHIRPARKQWTILFGCDY